MNFGELKTHAQNLLHDSGIFIPTSELETVINEGQRLVAMLTFCYEKYNTDMDWAGDLVAYRRRVPVPQDCIAPIYVFDTADGERIYPTKLSQLELFGSDWESNTGDNYLHYVLLDPSFISPASITADDPMIANGNMELDSNWSNYNAPTTNERSSEQAHGGTYSRKFVSAGNSGIKSDTFTTVTGETYPGEVWVYPVDGTGFSIFIRRGDDSGNSYGAYALSGLTANTWNRHEISFTETAGGDGAYVAIYRGATGVAVNYVDDVGIGDFLAASIGDRIGCRRNYRMLVYPTVNTTSLQINMIYAASPPTMSNDSDIPKIPPGHESCLVDYALFYAWSKRKGPTALKQSLEVLKRFFGIIGVLNDLMKSRYPQGRDFEPVASEQLLERFSLRFPSPRPKKE